MSTILSPRLLLIILASLGSVTAPAATPASETVEKAMQAEFAAAEGAIHVVLERRGDGDVAGAELAERLHQAHSARYLELKGRLEQIKRSYESTPPPRSPFTPDPSWLAAVARREQSESSSTKPAWDLYGRGSQGGRSTPWGMYGALASSEGPEPEASSTSKPYLVYRSAPGAVVESRIPHPPVAADATH